MDFAAIFQNMSGTARPRPLCKIKTHPSPKMNWKTAIRTSLLLMTLFKIQLASAGSSSQEIACVEFSSAINIDCLCSLNELNATRINCDNVVFPGDFPVLPLRYYIQEFTQKNVGWQLLPTQIFTASDIPLKLVDFSHNSMRRLAEKLFEKMEDTLEEIYLSHNLLGDNLNTVFSTDEFHDLKFLRVLDLSYNGISGISVNLIKGCEQLKELRLDGNRLKRVPSESLSGPTSLQNLHLQDNVIDKLSPLVLAEQPKLLSVNMSNNLISEIQPGAFANMTRLVRLILSKNKLTKLDSGSLSGVSSLVELELSNNFLESIPIAALASLKNLKFLNLGSNKIKSVADVDLESLGSLEYLDLSRNLIQEIMPGTFMGMANLKGLDFSVNVVRKVEDDAFEGLRALEYLDLSDNKVLSLPAVALSRLPNLKRLKIDYNRIGALSYDILRSVKGLEELSLAYNIIREIPEGTFKDLKDLKILNLYGNKIAGVNAETFMGVESNLEYMDLGFNIINDITRISYPKLRYLNLEKNMIRNISNVFNLLTSLQVLNLGENMIDQLPAETFRDMTNLLQVNLNKNKVRNLEPGVFENAFLTKVNMSGNQLTEIQSKSFSNLEILEVVDLSGNQISAISNGAFDRIPHLKTLHLQKNRLNSYKGDIYSGMGNDTELEYLDLSDNEITYLYPESFQFHPRLKWVNFAKNRFAFFPTQFIKSLTQLEYLDLEKNQIKSLEDNDFANMPKLRRLKLAMNEIESISKTAFQNSSQLQYIDISHNNISQLKSDVFNGIMRLQLDASYNNLTYIPEKLFEKRKVFRLESIDLSHNQFTEIPVNVLQNQYFSLETLKISHNNIKVIPSDANILVNVKEMDLSFNPLTTDSINNVLNEPKTVRSLNMAGTGITEVPVLETPFLLHLNLSHNDIKIINDDILAKAKLMETLDVSYNRLPNLSAGLASTWPKLTSMRHLDISHNPITYIIRGDFKYLTSLESLSMIHLDKCTKIDRNAFSKLVALKSLKMYGYPKVAYIDVKGILGSLNTLENVHVEVKDPTVGDHLTPAFSPRLKSVGVMGDKIQHIAISALVGISSKAIDINIENTNIANLPTAIFFPVPMSSKIKLDVKGSKITSIGPQLLSTLDSKQRHIRLEGLSTNPVYCDCNARPLQRWLSSKSKENTLYDDLENVRCSAPDFLAGKLLEKVSEGELTCEGRPSTTTTEVTYSTSRTTTQSELEIIWEPENKSTRRPKPSVTQPTPLPKQTNPSQLANMDSVIIGIVGGVVAFITIIIIIICIVRLRLADNQYRGGPLAGPLALRAQGKCTCLKPMPPPPMTPTIYGNHGFISYPSTPVPPPNPPLALTWNGTVTSQKMLQGPASVHGSHFGTVGANSYMSAGQRSAVSRAGSHYPGPHQGQYPGPATPYYVTFPADSDNEQDRRSHR